MNTNNLRMTVLTEVHDTLHRLLLTPEAYGKTEQQAAVFQEASDFFTFADLKIKDAAGPYSDKLLDLSVDHFAAYEQCKRWIQMLGMLYGNKSAPQFERKLGDPAIRPVVDNPQA